MVFVLVSYVIVMVCDKPNRPQTQWCKAAILMLMGLQGSCGLVGLTWAQVGGSHINWGLAGLIQARSCFFFFVLRLRLRSGDSCARSIGGRAKLEVYQRPLFVSCLLMSHWPSCVTWPSPEPMGQGSKIHPQRKEKGSEYLLNKQILRGFKNCVFLHKLLRIVAG